MCRRLHYKGWMGRNVMGDLLLILLLLLVIFSVHGFLVLMVISTATTFLARGTHLRHKAVTAIITLSWVVMIGSGAAILFEASQREMLGAGLSLFRLVFTYLEWRKFKDEDNWWKGRGKKWLKSIDKAISRLSPTRATAAA